MVRAVGLDHIVLNVADVERSIGWYVDELGLEPVRLDEFRRGEVFFPSVRIDEGTLIDFLGTAPTGTNVDHVCLVIEPTDLDALRRVGPVRRRERTERGVRQRGGWAARSTCVIPTANLVELRVY